MTHVAVGTRVAIPHGTTGGYTNHDCRCADCRRAWTAYNRENRRQRKAAGICIMCPRPRDGEHVRCRQHHAQSAAKPRHKKQQEAQ